MNKTFSFEHKITMCLFFLLIARLISIIFIPINDTTEARYAEIAREMLETHHWLIPKLYYTVPFLAKPPLSFWASALSMKVFGVNAFGARFPAFAFSCAMLYLTWKMAAARQANTALFAVLILSANIFFFLDAGAVMTEPTLMLTVTLAMFSFWQALSTKQQWYSDLFFLAVGLGLLAKGLVIFIFVGLPLFFWVLAFHQWSNLWHSLRWIRGTLIFFAVVTPWYLLAEYHNPGFLHYFFISEHFERFLIPGWSGDKYGYVHNTPIGMIWFYALIGIAPWQGLIAYYAIKNTKRFVLPFKSKHSEDKLWYGYLICFAFIPLCVLTFSRNVIYPYAFSSSVPLSLLIWEMFSKLSNVPKRQNLFLFTATFSASAFLLVTLLFSVLPNILSKTQKPVVDMWRAQASKDSRLIYWSASPPDFSAMFYSQGHAIHISDTQSLLSHLEKNPHDLLVVNATEKELPEALQSRCEKISTLPLRKKIYSIYRVNACMDHAAIALHMNLYN